MSLSGVQSVYIDTKQLVMLYSRLRIELKWNNVWFYSFFWKVIIYGLGRSKNEMVQLVSFRAGWHRIYTTSNRASKPFFLTILCQKNIMIQQSSTSKPLKNLVRSSARMITTKLLFVISKIPCVWRKDELNYHCFQTFCAQGFAIRQQCAQMLGQWH